MTGSQKVVGSNPISSTRKPSKAKTTSSHLLISPNSYTQLDIPLQRLIEGFLLSCKVENKSPATISFYKNILDKFQWFLDKFGINAIDATTIRGFLGYLKDTTSRWDSKNTHANRPVCAYTVDRYYTALSALFRWDKAGCSCHIACRNRGVYQRDDPRGGPYLTRQNRSPVPARTQCKPARSVRTKRGPRSEMDTVPLPQQLKDGAHRESQPGEDAA